ncbi:hypothetical protein [Glycomyces harbinensis]|uniref:Uncharacterized protein n=1 Tax=Glycomyces harbinensis TaxID=58114 RepID=A0A1G6W0W3_9ACTN|nr:hypothetical protein [Glycomyces harbinensis]SDD58696.1 hypothetical protein SAMN05216270_105206 [Glycomyces harbinensis]
MNDELPDRLRVSAEEYEPDRDRMWSRVAEGMREPRGVAAEPVRSGWRISHLALATGAAVVLIGGVVLFGQTLGLGPVVGPSPEPPAAGPASSAPETSEPATTGAETSTGEASDPDSDDVETTGDEGGETEAPAWLRTDGSVDQGSGEYWSQANLKLENDEPLAELDVELRVAIGEGLQSTGSWTTDSRFTDAVVTEEDGFLVYRWSLREGQVLPAGEYTLAGQFNHGSGARSAEDDDFTFEAATESGEDGRTEGDFA